MKLQVAPWLFDISADGRPVRVPTVCCCEFCAPVHDVLARKVQSVIERGILRWRCRQRAAQLLQAVWRGKAERWRYSLFRDETARQQWVAYHLRMGQLPQAIALGHSPQALQAAERIRVAWASIGHRRRLRARLEAEAHAACTHAGARTRGLLNAPRRLLTSPALELMHEQGLPTLPPRIKSRTRFISDGSRGPTCSTQSSLCREPLGRMHVESCAVHPADQATRPRPCTRDARRSQAYLCAEVPSHGCRQGRARLGLRSRHYGPLSRPPSRPSPRPVSTRLHFAPTTYRLPGKCRALHLPRMRPPLQHPHLWSWRHRHRPCQLHLRSHSHQWRRCSALWRHPCTVHHRQRHLQHIRRE